MQIFCNYEQTKVSEVTRYDKVKFENQILLTTKFLTNKKRDN